MRLARGGERKTEMCERLIFFFFGDDHMATSSYLLRNRYRFGCLLFRESLLCNSESLENLLEWRHAWTFPSGFSQSHSMCVLQPAHSCELAGEMVTLRCFCEICFFSAPRDEHMCWLCDVFSWTQSLCWLPPTRRLSSHVAANLMSLTNIQPCQSSNQIFHLRIK